MNKNIKKALFISLLMISGMCVQAETVSKPVKLKAETNTVNMAMVIKDNFVKAKYASAENRFMQGHVKVAHDDYADLIARTNHDDYVFLSYGIKMAEYGLFNLSEDLFKRLDNNIYTKNYINDIKNYYYPSGMVNTKDILYLADAYSGIVYNNLALEMTSELINTNQVDESDYKNYLIALGSYKSNNFSKQ